MSVKHTLMTGLLLAVATAPPAAGGASTKPGAEEGSLFARQIAPLLASHCATCHLTGEEAGHMSLVPDRAIASLVNARVNEAPALTRVVPGKPDQSYIVMKIEGTQVAHGGTGARMPFGAPPLSTAQIALIRRWIKEGARP